MHRILLGLTASFLFLLSAPSCSAAEAHAKGGIVFLNSVPVLELKTEPSLNVNHLIKVLRLADDEAEVNSKQAGSESKIVVGTDLALVITPAEAAKHGTSAERLADKWASTIRDALSLPPLKFSLDYLRSPLGTSAQVGLVGSLAFTSAVSTSNDAVVKVDRTECGFIVHCVGIGDAQIRAVSGNSQRTFNVFVRPYAGVFPQQFSVEVTGDPASESTVAGAVSACIKTKLICLPTATCAFQPVRAECVPGGASKTYSVWVHLRAPEAFDGAGNVTVTVRNARIGRTPDTALWYSNSPESVYQVGPLFSSFLKREKPVRLLYHHVDMSSQPMILRVEAINDSDVPAKVMVIPGDTKPDLNPVRAGLTAAFEYLSLWQFNSGDVIQLPPHSTFPISIHRVIPKETVSGLCTLRLLEGPDELQVRTDALPGFELQGTWYDASFSSTPWRETGTHAINDYDRALSEPSLHIYPNPYKEERMEYQVGGRFGFLLIGQKPISGEDHTNNLDGNFGVIYKIKANMSNPSGQPTDVELVFEASAGYMGGLFFVDGKLSRTHLLGPKSEERIARFHLDAGASRTVDIVTLPVSGGSYPATLFLRPLPANGSGG